MASPYVVDVDLGQVRDATAVAVVEWAPAAGDAAHCVVRHLERLPLGTPYPAVAARLVTMFAAPPLAGGTLVVDHTGVGRPVVDLLRQAQLAEQFLHRPNIVPGFQ